MGKAIIVTGTPGTGKTTLTKLLMEKGYYIIDVGSKVKEEKLYDFFDKKMQSFVIDDEKLNNYLIDLIENTIDSEKLIIEGHVMRLPPQFVSHCIVLRCSIRNLRQRLVERNYSESKIDENVEAEIMEVVLSDMLYLYGENNVSVISTDGTVEESLNRLLNLLKEL